VGRLRRLKFTFITDSRFDKKIYHKIVAMDKQLKELLKHLPVKLEETKIKKLHWKKTICYDVSTHQCRKTYYLNKFNRSITWNDVYRTINTIQAPYYEFK